MFVNICNIWNGQCYACPFAYECGEGRDNMIDIEVLKMEIKEKIENLQIMLNKLEQRG